MRRIEKGREPDCLATARDTAELHGAKVSKGDWELPTGDCKAEIRERLFSAQHGLCAYCQSPLRHAGRYKSNAPDEGGTKIEHWRGRSEGPERTLDWDNLLGVCPGIIQGGGTDGDEYHCDKARSERPVADQALNYNPSAYPPDVATKFTFPHDGSINGTDDAANSDIEVLNLNVDRLRRNRKAIIDKIRERIRKQPRRATLQTLWETALIEDENGCLTPYVGMIEYYVEKKLRQWTPKGA